MFFDDFSLISEGSGLKYFKNWQSISRFLMLEKWDFENNKIIRERTSLRLAKRGDFVYKYNLNQKFKWINQLPDKNQFNFKDRSKSVFKTHFLFLTHTTQNDNRYYPNFEKSALWKRDSKVWNRAITRLRQHFGDVFYIRSNEGTEKGFPSPHSILYFKDHMFDVRRQIVKKGKYKGKIKYRVFGEEYRKLKRILEGKDQRAKKILGFTDFEGIYNIKKSTRYILKYCLNGDSDKKEIQDLTYFWLWITKKHTYTKSVKNKRFNTISFEEAIFKFFDLTLSLPISKVHSWVWVSSRVGSSFEADDWEVNYKKEVIPPWEVGFNG